MLSSCLSLVATPDSSRLGRFELELFVSNFNSFFALSCADRFLA